MQPLVWDDLRVFLAVVRGGSHKAAGRRLAVDPTTVGRRIAALEQALGTKLLSRSPEALSPTAAGRGLNARAERVEAELLAAVREVEASDARLEGSLRVTATDGFIHYVLLPALGELRRAHPSLAIELRGDTRVLDLSRHEADVAVRLGRPKETALVARRLGQVEFGLYASDAYLDRRGHPRSLRAIAGHDLIGFDASLDDVEQVRWIRRVVRDPRYVVRANTTTAQALACAEGHGVALLPSYVAAREPRCKRLLPRLLGPTRELWAVTHQDLRHNARVVAFQDFLTDAVRSARAPAAGGPGPGPGPGPGR